VTYSLSYIISFLIGFFLLAVILRRETSMLLSTRLFLSMGLGLGISAYIVFCSFLFLDRLDNLFVIAGHFILLALLVFIGRQSFRKEDFSLMNFRKLKSAGIRRVIPWIVLAASGLTLYLHAGLYPLGGWDAWSCWNLKAKFLFLGGADWKNILDPALWRSSPHYPLLLPLVNVWGWIWAQDTAPIIPLINSVLFSLITVGLLLSGLKMVTGRNTPGILGACFLITLPFFNTLATSQYADIVVAYFVLAALLCFVIAWRGENKIFLFLTGLFLGFLSFSKSEGTIAALILAAIMTVTLLVSRKTKGSLGLNSVLYFLSGLLIASLPTIIFQLLYAPPNQTFTSIFSGLTERVGLYRLKAIALFFLAELTSAKWGGIWIILLAGMILSVKKSLRQEKIVFPAFFALYGLTVAFYYWLNTYFEILWWLSVSLNRILFSLLPAALFWILYSFWEDNNKEGRKA